MLKKAVMSEANDNKNLDGICMRFHSAKKDYTPSAKKVVQIQDEAANYLSFFSDAKRFICIIFLFSFYSATACYEIDALQGSGHGSKVAVRGKFPGKKF